MNSRLKKPIGLFLCGGGAFGSFQSGVIKKLAENGLEADVVAGFSIGALNGAAWCFDKVKELKSIWEKVDNRAIFRLSPAYHHMPIELYKTYPQDGFLSSFKARIEDKVSRMTLFSNKPVYKILYEWLGRHDLIFNKKVTFHVIAHCVERKLPYIITYEGKTSDAKVNFIDALVASSSIPVIFPPVKIRERGEKLHLVDGGALGVATVNLNMFDGCRSIIMVSNSSDYDLNYEKKGFLGYFESRVRRTLALHVQKIYESQIFVRSSPKVHLIKPARPLDSGIIDFTPVTCLKHFQHGEDCAERFVREIQ
ncbi:MAG: hypothetical protein Fur0012_13040 [Elusimicrobiota bacterium]